MFKKKLRTLFIVGFLDDANEEEMMGIYSPLHLLKISTTFYTLLTKYLDIFVAYINLEQSHNLDNYL